MMVQLRHARLSRTLQIVPIADILIHEAHDPDRIAPLAGSIARDGIQRHPVILAATEGGLFVHLDGANRITTLAALDCRFVAAQVANYADDRAVALETWLHLTTLHEDELHQAARDWPGCALRQSTPEQAIEALNGGQAVAAALFANGAALTLHSSDELSGRVAALWQLTGRYRAPVRREAAPRLDMLADVQQLLGRHPDTNVCVAFARIAKRDILALARELRLQLPGGISRHMLRCGRVLNIDAPLELLRAPGNAEEKTLALHRLLRERSTRDGPVIAYER